MILKRKNLAILIAGSLPLVFSTTASASYCQPTSAATYGNAANPYAGNCPQNKGVSVFTGDASSYISTFGTEIGEAGKAIAEQIAANTSAEIDALQTSNAKLMETMTTIANTAMKDGLTQDKQLLDMKMEYMSELQERELKANQSVIAMDDSKEEVLFILSELKNVSNGSEGAYNHAHEVIAAMKSKYDDDPTFVMPIRIKAGDTKNPGGEGCPEYDPEKHKAGQLNGSCFYAVKSSPGSKLEKYFQECSRVKSESLAAVQSSVSQRAVTRKQLEKQAGYSSSTAKGVSVPQMAKEKVDTQIETSCTPNEFKFKLCAEDMDAREYITNVIDNQIIPYGNVSSSNYLAPVSIGSVDGDVGEMSEADIKTMRITAQQKRDASGNPIEPDTVVSSNTPPLVKTYRTSAQYFAAEDFISNIINREAISGLPVEAQTNAEKAVFHSKFMSRNASLSLAENSLRQPIQARLGTDLSAAVATGELTRDGILNKDTGEKEVLKEDLNGASPIDRLAFAINKDYARISTDAQSAANSGGTVGIETAAPGALTEWQIESLIRTNQLLLLENEQNERIELLLAAMLANSTNSKENVDYINSFKFK
jgi:hypothetical protein